MTTQKQKIKSARFKKWWYSDAGRSYRERVREKRNIQHKKYRQSEKGKIVQIRKANKMRLKYPEKWKARQKLRYAVRVGKVIKKPCEVCGDVNVFGHHNDYSKPFEVRWLCRKHHRELHGNKS